jgi:hypothetical protein
LSKDLIDNKNRFLNFGHQNFDWDAFSAFEDGHFEIFIDRVRPFFASFGVNFSNDVLYILFGELVSKFSFNKFINNHDKVNFLSLAFKEKCIFDTLEPIDLDLLILGGFHRHPEFEAAFVDLLPPDVKVGKLTKSKKEFFFEFFFVIKHLKKFELAEYSGAIIKRICFILVNKNLFCGKIKVFDIIGSAHGIYNDAGALMLALARVSSGRIFIVQPGFIHLQAKYIYQVKYELKICDHYLGWGGCENNHKVYDIGSMYSWRSKRVEKKSGALVILPQVPNLAPRAFSFYWSCFSDFEADLGRIIDRIIVLKQKYETIKFRCKSVDEKFYLSVFAKNNLDLSIDCGDINGGDHFEAYEQTHVFYLSTAIPEAFYKGSCVHFEFTNSSFLLGSDYDVLIDFFEKRPVNQKDLEVYLKSFALPTTPDVYAQKLIRLMLT